MAASNPSGGDLPLLYGQCANCLVFGWKQPLPAVLRKCSKCKVLQYCGESCQKEHWKLVHKHHCKKLAAVKMGEGGGLVGIFSPPPFADAELLDDPHDALVMLMQYVLQKIFYSNQPAFNKVQVQLFQLRELLKWTMETIWARKKICPVEVKDFSLYRHGEIFEETAVIQDENLAGQDSWLMLHLVWGRLFDNRCVGRVNSMKNPREAIPEDFWVGVQQEVGPFSSRVADLIKAFSGTQFPSFQQLLQILCGGSLRQACSFCNTNITVASVYGEVKGSYGLGAPFVALLPYLPPIFGCGAFTCAKGMGEKRAAHNKWRSGVGAMYIKLKPNKCDFCFKLTEEVHRCKKCLTKTYCSKDCQAKDWEEKHQGLCQSGGEERKVKGGSEARLEAGLRDLESGFELNLKPKICGENVGRTEEAKNMLVKAKEMCEKKGKEGKKVKAGKSGSEKKS